MLTIDPASNLSVENEYAVEVSNDAITDLASPPNAFGSLQQSKG